MMVCNIAGAASNASILYVGEFLLLSNWRGTLIKSLHKTYFANNVYFRMVHLDQRMGDPDHRIANDVSAFMLKAKLIFFGTPMYSGTLPVLVSTCWFSKSLIESTGYFTVCGALAFFMFFSILNRLIMIPATNASSMQGKLHSDFSFAHTYFRMHGEHVAFLGGADTERDKMNTMLDNMVTHARHEALIHVPLNFSSNVFYWGITCASYLIPGAQWSMMGDESLADVDKFITTQSLCYSLLIHDGAPLPGLV